MQKRIILSIILGMSIILIGLGVVSYYIVDKSIENSLDNRLALAHLIGNYIDNIIQGNLTRLYDISVSGGIDLEDNDFEPEKKALRTAYMYSIFTDGIFLLDRRGNAILTYPPRSPDSAVNISSILPVNRIIAEGRHIVSNIYTIEPTKRKVIFALVPLKDKNGRIVGIAGGEIDPTNPMLSQMLKAIDIGKSTFIEIIDSNGVIIASTNPLRVLTWCDHDKFFNTMINTKKTIVRTCHQCHSETDKRKSENILAFTPLETAPWGISIQQPREEVFAPTSKLKKTFFALGIIFISTAIALTIGMRKSIIKPIRSLIDATERIAKGDLSNSISPQGSDEIGTLSRSFETMRIQLAESLENIRRYSSELEMRVIERTEQIRYTQQQVENLLKKVISSQEEERKRIARELHDETLQLMSILLMKIDMCKLYFEHHPGSVKDKMKSTDRKILYLDREPPNMQRCFEEMKDIILEASDGIHNIVQNLRPSILDDLGIEASIRWLLDRHLGEKGINYFLNIEEIYEKRFDPVVEIILFRIIQEAIINIAKHSRAENVFVILKSYDNAVNVEIEDDGEGFDVRSMLRHTEERRGLGLLGMKERAALLNGRLEICSSTGSGTRISLKVPLEPLEV
ncbi:MAG: cache domain-containing protein [Nitrospirota bacterium]